MLTSINEYRSNIKDLEEKILNLTGIIIKMLVKSSVASVVPLRSK